MPRKAKELSAVEVKRLAHPGTARNATFAVGGVSGLLLQVTPGGAKSWLLRCTIGTKRREIGLGAYPDVSLARAREKAREAREAIAQGSDPVEERKAHRASLVAAQKRGLRFDDAVDRFLKNKLDEFRNEKHRKQWRSSLDAYATPTLGGMLVADIQVGDVQRALEPIWTTKTETASRLRGRIEAVLSWATVGGYRDGANPARWKGNLDAILSKPSKLKHEKHRPAVALDDAARWFAEVQKRNGTGARALEFVMLTAARSGEVRGAVWSEVDIPNRLWTIPGLRMKAKKDHRVPLTDRAIALLEALPKMEGSDYVFAAPRGGTLSDMTLSGAMRRIHADDETGGFRDPRDGRLAVVHGLRSCFRDWVAERTNFPSEMAEISLAHTVGSAVERAYRRTDMLEKRRGMLATWQRFLEGEEGKKIIRLEARR